MVDEMDPVLRLRGFVALGHATHDGSWTDRAFETLAVMIEGATPTFAPAAPRRPHARTIASQVHRVGAAARIDLGGGWTDTPPYSIERGGTVLNAAITLNGAHPIFAETAWLTEPRLVLQCCDIDATIEPTTAGEVLRYADPADPFALHKAGLVLSGIVPANSDPAAPITAVLAPLGGGVRLTTGASIPRGSGLGTSSILAGAVLAALDRLLATAAETHVPAPDFQRLFDEVLCLEQMLTTGGGWQDQAGGLTGGIKLVTTQPGLPQRLRVAPVELSPRTRADLDSRLLLVYTGQQRLAKDLLRHVMARWMARDPEMVWILEEIARLAVAMRDALLADDVDGFGELLGEHWAVNKRMDPGCTNPFIDGLFETTATAYPRREAGGCRRRWVCLCHREGPRLRGCVVRRLGTALSRNTRGCVALRHSGRRTCYWRVMHEESSRMRGRWFHRRAPGQEAQGRRLLGARGGHQAARIRAVGGG